MRNIRGWLTALILLAGICPARAEPPVIPPLLPVPSAPPAQSRFRDWAIACAPDCRAFTRLRSAAPGAPEVLRLTLAPTGAAEAGPRGVSLSLRTPLPLYLPDPLLLTVGDLPPVSVPWFTCGRSGCEARATAGPEVAEALRDGRVADVEITLVGGEHARLRLSLLGLGAALRAAGALTP